MGALRDNRAQPVGDYMACDEATVLIVDDSAANLRVLRDLLENQGYPVRAFRRGEQALLAIQEQPPDLIMLDIQMPEMDGFEVCEQLKQIPAAADIPVIFISARTDTAHKMRAFQVGGVDYVTKPFQSKEVLARVGVHVAFRRARAQLRLKIADLERYNQALNQVIHAASHDLRAPLNDLVNLIGFIEEDIGPSRLPGETARHLSLVRERVARMGNLLDGVLVYAKLARSNQLVTTFRLDELAAEMSERIEMPAGHTLRWNLAPVVTTTERASLVRVLTSLIENAIRHHDLPHGESAKDNRNRKSEL